MPILVATGQPAHLDPEDQTDMLHGNFGQDAVKSATIFGRLAAEPLVVIDDQDTVARPSQCDCEVEQRVLTFARFSVIENLLRSGLTDVDDRQQTEVPVGDQARPGAT
jgi:hypothetical protein